MQVAWDSTGSIEGIFGSRSRHKDQGLLQESLARKLVKAYLDHDYICYHFLLPSFVIDTMDCINHEPSFYKSNSFETFVFDVVLAISTANVFKFDWQMLPNPESHHTRAMSAVTTVHRTGPIRHSKTNQRPPKCPTFSTKNIPLR